MKYQLIFAPEGRVNDDGIKSPLYLTVCKRPHWTMEGLMLTSGMYDATKFELDDPDIEDILNYCRDQLKDKKFCTVDIRIIIGRRKRK